MNICDPDTAAEAVSQVPEAKNMEKLLMKESSKIQRYSNGEKGLTLVEMIISIAIIGMLALFFSPRFIEGMRMMEHSRRSNISSNLANSEMEYLRSLDFDEITALAGEDPINKEITVDKHIYDVKTIIIGHIADGTDGLVGFTIRVIVETDQVILDEPIRQSVQSYISR